jgi:adenylate cyclase
MMRRPTRRSLRLASGVVLFAYVAAHFVNHALGLISIGVAEQGLHLAVAVWQSPVGTLILYGAAGLHVGLAFVAIYQHRTLRLPALEWLRIAAGLSIPTLLIGHAVDTRLALELNGRPTDYAHVVWMLWHSGREGRQVALLVPGWLHGCLGLNFALANRAWYSRWRLPLFGAALLLPVLSVLGFSSMLKEVTQLALDPGWIATVRPPIEAGHHPLTVLREGLLVFYYCAIAALFVSRLIRRFVEERRGSLVSIGYPDRTVRVPRGWSVLEASRAHHIAHVSMCGGRARCSTCRVGILSGQADCPPPSDDERRTLLRIDAPEGTRLACQLRPRGDVCVVPLVTPAARPRRNSPHIAIERELAVLLVDVRWGGAQRNLLPHDLLHALDRLGEVVAETSRGDGGVPTPFAGDRLMVLFGLDGAAADANHRALRAAVRLDARLRALHLQLLDELGCDMQHVIHLHCGPAVVGESGHLLARTLTATGGAVDVIRQLAAAQGSSQAGGADHEASQIVVSRAVFEAARSEMPTPRWLGLDLPDGKRLEFARLASGAAAGVVAGA